MNTYRMPDWQEIPPQKLVKIAAGVVVGIFVLWGVLSCFYTVGANSEAVVLRFGAYRDTTGPGLHGKLPFGIDRALVVPVRDVKTVEFGFLTHAAGKKTVYGRTTRDQAETSTMLTGDLNIADVTWALQYQIKDPKLYLFKVRNVEGTIRDVSEAVMRTLVGDRSVDEIITIGRLELETQARDATQDKLDKLECGVALKTLKLQEVGPPEEVKEAFNNVNRARQKKEEVINQAQAKRNSLVPAARGKAQGGIKQAEAYGDRLIREVTGRTNALLAKVKEYNQAKRETRTRLYLETMEKILIQCERKIIIDESVRGVLPLLDLDVQKGGAQ